MYVLTYNDNVFLGPIAWKPRMFAAVIEQDYDVIVNVPSANPYGIKIDLTPEITIWPAEYGPEPVINEKIQRRGGPFYSTANAEYIDVQQDVIDANGTVIGTETVQDMVKPERKIITYVAEDFTVEQARGLLKGRVQRNRKRKEQEGANVAINGTEYVVPTSREERSAFLLHKSANRGPVTWKFGSEQWETLNPQDLATIEGAIVDHVQAQYDWEKTTCDALDAATTLAELDAIDLGDPVEEV